MNKTYSKYDEIPTGLASTNLTEGCLVVEGGAFRGVYAQGVMDALMVNDINMQSVIGVSAGALGGMNYVAGQIGRSAQLNLGYRNDSNYVSFRHRKRYGGFINFDFMLRDTPLGPLNEERFYDERRRFVAVVTNCRTGETEFLEKNNCSDMMLALQASASMPFISDMINLDGNEYLDGGCSLKVPFQWALDNNYNRIVVIRTRHKDYRYEKTDANKLALRIYGKDYPAFALKLAKSNERYNADCERMNQLEEEGKLFVISPSETWSVGRVESDMERLGEWYRLGYHDAERKMKLLKEYLTK